jgi:hypothetical protein
MTTTRKDKHLIQIRVSRSTLKAIDRYRRELDDIPTRASTISRIIEQTVSHLKPTEASPA